MKIQPRQRRIRVALKRFIYSQLYQRDAFRLMFGRSKPLVQFKVEATPPSVYWNFEIDPARVAGLREELDLPFELSPIRCLDGEEPFHCLTLNMYRVSGLANGIRAEWSLYIKDDLGTPRYLVVEAQADSGSLDSVNLLTRKGEATHTHEDGILESRVVAADGGQFSSRLEALEDGTPVRIAPEWVQANDYIYWMNGICDRTFYDSGMANPRARQLPTAGAKIEDTTGWGRLVTPEPRNIIVYEDAIEFAMSPWWNLDEMTDDE
jgi:hypothetical protein